MRKLFFLSGLFFMLIMQSCYYDNMENLYPDSGAGCDTTSVTFTAVIWPIIQSNCTGCHSGSAASGNVSLENYNDVAVYIENKRLMGTIRHETGFSPMPKGGNQLSDCDITKLEMWINNGYANN